MATIRPWKKAEATAMSPWLLGLFLRIFHRRRGEEEGR
jgi:hypothetical protein